MRIAVFSTKSYDQQFFDRSNQTFGHELHFLEPRLTESTLPLARGFECICAFVNDQLDERILQSLSKDGLRLVALRCAGFNNVDLHAAEALGVSVVRVPAYSPHAVAEHAAALMLSLSRNLHRAYARVREGNFSLEGLLGSDFHGVRTIGVVGTGKIGEAFCRICLGLGCRVVAFDVTKNPECEKLGVEYVALEELYCRSDVISLHCPLAPATHHLINDDAIRRMKDGVMLINTSRGAIVDSSALVRGLKSGHVGSVGLDVYEEEADLFFEDLSNNLIQDDVFARLLTFPNVIVTGHQAFFTEQAMTQIADTTLQNVSDFEKGEPLHNRVDVSFVKG